AWASDANGEPMPAPGTPGERGQLARPVIDPDSADAYRVVRNPTGAIRGAPAAHRGLRTAHAWALQNFRLAFASEPAGDATILLRPQLADRVAAVAPFFVQGRDVRAAVAGDTLYWIVELYTASATYPLSEPLTLAGEQRRYFH